MLSNVEAARYEHGCSPGRLPDSIRQRLLNPSALPQPLAFKLTESSKQGKRPSQEDSHFIKQESEGLLIGVFDGHGGQKVSNYLAQQFPQRFFETLRKTDDVFRTFEEIANAINGEILRKPEYDFMGSTGLVSFIDPKVGIVYTMTVGDSEAKLYGDNEEYPLSLVRDWSCPEERARVEVIYGKEKIKEHYKDVGAIAKEKGWDFAKCLRFPQRVRLNVSRAFGDKHVAYVDRNPLVVMKPEITMHPIEPKQTLVLACDGLWDYAKDKVIDLLEQTESQAMRLQRTASSLGTFALDECSSTDNVTIIAIKVFVVNEEPTAAGSGSSKRIKIDPDENS